MVYSYKGEARTMRHKRALQQLEYQIKYHFGEDRANALLNYGCYCGRSGESDPLDDVDQCCKNHEDCYDLEEDCLPKTLFYEFNLGNKTVNCENSPNSCEGRVCKCDETFVDCLQNKEFNPDYYNADQDEYCDDGCQ
ncbi:secretory phospholipase A2 [Mytilus galloprovincialis]|uniref:Phospholipase A2 n=1 Tax=Mytilus galloprovincialis TaxID=29158 RepID=A0A8B6DJK2_MYTGA|nr:secretory phospholipase A2 [Mytilus galloprovincialis]